MSRPIRLVAGLALAVTCSAAWPQSGTTNTETDPDMNTRSETHGQRGMDTNRGDRSARRDNDAARNAVRQVSAATGVVRDMERDPGVAGLLADAAGVFIVPRYTRAALGIGARGGEGVLLARNGNGWSDPLFYNLAGVSIGAQAGVEGGEMALVLRSQRALDRFRNNNNWSLNADAGLTVVNWSRAAEVTARAGDVVVWSARQGLFGDLAVSVTDIHFDQDENAAFYGRPVAVQDVLGGSTTAAMATQQIAGLKQALAGAGRGSTMGGAGSGERPLRNSRERRYNNRQGTQPNSDLYSKP